MKKQLLVLLLAVAAGTALFAEGAREKTVTVEGKLAVTKGIPSIVAGDASWILPSAPFYRIAWENGIKVGDTVKAEGFVRTGPGPDAALPGADSAQGDSPKKGMPAKKDAPAADARTDSGISCFIPTRVWVNGKELDLSSIDQPMMQGMGPRDGGPMRQMRQM